MSTQLELGEITAEVVRKNIKHLHLSVYPPAGKVRISAPLRMNLETIRVFALTRLGWIKEQQRKLRAQDRETPREYLERESHYVWGQRYLLEVRESPQAPAVEQQHHQLVLRIRAGATPVQKEAALSEWYRDQLKSAVPELITKWEPRLGVKVARFYVQRMKTKWGSCSPETRSIRLNTELAKKPVECLEYIVVHEMVHLLEPTHNARFVTLLTGFLPNWSQYRDLLNSLPVRHEEWDY